MDRKRKINGKKFTFICFHALNIILIEEQQYYNYDTTSNKDMQRQVLL